jgi:hypothetical protein
MVIGGEDLEACENGIGWLSPPTEYGVDEEDDPDDHDLLEDDWDADEDLDEEILDGVEQLDSYHEDADDLEMIVRMGTLTVRMARKRRKTF